MPWALAWTGEQGFALRRSVIFPGMVELVQRENQGVGEPVFTGVHVSRHRRAMAEHLCHVCGAPTPPEDRHIFPVVTGGMVPLGDGTWRYGGNVPPLHLACAERARRACPQLRRRLARPELCPTTEARLVWRTDVVPGMETLAALLPKGQEVVLSCYRLYDAAFTARVEQLRAAAG